MHLPGESRRLPRRSTRTTTTTAKQSALFSYIVVSPRASRGLSQARKRCSSRSVGFREGDLGSDKISLNRYHCDCALPDRSATQGNKRKSARKALRQCFVPILDRTMLVVDVDDIELRLFNEIANRETNDSTLN